ncbi:MBL fold metallo-hydrolase [Deinococcus deserti]|uniref:beta-lactamase n=1 Tax=Deinococcus deserti (strain DSM 17065 / CIP 109153 / LMG 22923 / VCD115) TaxID=546414 RepID=C1CYW5_DEIDV|nr:MBL fold metallo-hydrolase [Deinococcus deserti]ACO47145.1 putative Metallo-beta-lactamase superfamily protein; putative Zinc metallohydrolase, glyoxalase II family [Deinococcus deserti VCD115]
MSALVPLGPGIWYLPGAVNSVVVENGEGGALLIDTGLDDAHARKLLRAVESAGLSPSAILNTHSHADHHGGNAFILKKSPELTVYAPPLEAAVINHPMLEPLMLFGASPPPELRTKFLLAPASPAQPIPPGRQILGGVELDLIPVPGHAVDMYAVQLGEVLYVADALFGLEALAKHPLTFCSDSAAQKVSAAGLMELSSVGVILPGHGDPTVDLPGLVGANLTAYERITAAVLATVQQHSGSVDDLLSRVSVRMGVRTGSPAAAVLNRAVVSAHLTELQAQKQVQCVTEHHRLVFRISP